MARAVTKPKPKSKRGNVANLVKPKKGERFGGRKKGSENVMTRVVKEAIVLAMEQSKHAKGKGLVGYFQHIADQRPDLMVTLAGRLIPLQIKGKFEATVEHTIKAKPEREMTPEELVEYYNKLRLRPASATPLLIEAPKLDEQVTDAEWSEAAE